VLLAPLARGATLLAGSLLVAQQIISDPAYTILEINQVSLRQAVTPHPVLGRVNACIEFVGLGAMLLGALVGGALGEAIGLRSTLVVGSGASFLAALWLRCSAVWRLKR